MLTFSPPHIDEQSPSLANAKMLSPIRQQIYDLAVSLFVKEDQPAIMNSLRTCLPRLSRCVLSEGNGEANTPLAFTVVTPGPSAVGSTIRIAFCGVSPLLQGKGIGTSILKETINGIFEAGYSACDLIVDDWNYGARRLYERLGFEVTADICEDHTVGVIMTRRAEPMASKAGTKHVEKLISIPLAVTEASAAASTAYAPKCTALTMAPQSRFLSAPTMSRCQTA